MAKAKKDKAGVQYGVILTPGSVGYTVKTFRLDGDVIEVISEDGPHTYAIASSKVTNFLYTKVVLKV